MKRTLSFMVMALALLLTQCRKPEVKFPTPSSAEGVTVSMTVTAGPGSKTDISDTGAITWSTGDKLYVGFDGAYVGCLTLQGAGSSATGTFMGNVTLPTGTTDGKKEFRFFYLGSNAPEGLTPGESTQTTVSFATQTGLLGDLGSCHIGYGTAQGTVAGNKVTGINVTLVSKVALARFSFKKSGTPVSPYTDALTLSGANIYNSMKVNFGGKFTGEKNDGGNINLDAVSEDITERYVMLVPPENVGEETLNFGDAYEGTWKLYSGIEANKYYGQDGPMVVVLTKAHEKVNFGTPNLNWSKYNLGVDPAKLTNAWDWYGDYYAWGEVVPYYTSLKWTSATACTVDGWNTEATLGGGGIVDASKGYAWQSYSHGSTGFKEWNVSPCTGSVPYDSDTKLLLPARDAATQAWGEGWRMPTKEEWQSLYDNNTFEWLAAGAYSKKVTSFKAVAAGYLVIKGKDSSLDTNVYMFLPAAGSRANTNHSLGGSFGNYWSSSLNTSYKPDYAHCMYFYADLISPQYYLYRYHGFTVRPVRAAL